MSPSTGAVHLTPGYRLLLSELADNTAHFRASGPNPTSRSPSPEDDDTVEMDSPRDSADLAGFSPASGGFSAASGGFLAAPDGFSFGAGASEGVLSGGLATPAARWGRPGAAINLGDGTPAAFECPVHFGGFGSPQGAPSPRFKSSGLTIDAQSPVFAGPSTLEVH